jgi:hypothetical protein
VIDLKPIDFLKESGQPWVVFRTLADLEGLAADDPAVKKARADMLSHPLVKGLMDELQGWPGTVLNSHRSAGQHYHKLSFLADLGVTAEDTGMKKIVSKIRSSVSEEGLFRLPTRIPEHYGGSGREELAWALCDAPITAYSLARMGLMDDPDLLRGVDHLLGLARENGWPCRVSENLGKFRGPGKKGDPCPYVNLIMLKLLSLFDEHMDGREARAGVESLLSLWEQSLTLHPYMFFMGTDFRKLKAPFIWYDIMHVADVLSRYPYAREDKRFTDMLGVIHSKAGKDGLYTPESVWTAWKGWDFAQKKEPSAWLTFLVMRIDSRMSEAGRGR